MAAGRMEADAPVAVVVEAEEWEAVEAPVVARWVTLTAEEG